jgi:ubiquinone biosynthesis O-methyltransferase
VPLRLTPTTSLSTTASPSVDESELRKFASQSDLWWNDVSGPFAALHSLNRVRVPLIQQALFDLSIPKPPPAESAGQPLQGFRILDVGCGGGILSEALARLGARVLGIDAATENVIAAAQHRDTNPRLVGRLAYESVTAEALLERSTRTSEAAETPGLFDAVVASEVIEHVRDPRAFVATCAGLVRPGGVLVVTTINRTVPSFLAAILAAEYALGLVPPGTHEWARFVTPEELSGAAEAAGLEVLADSGLAYNPITGEWCEMADLSVNYALVARRLPGLLSSSAGSREQTP